MAEKPKAFWGYDNFNFVVDNTINYVQFYIRIGTNTESSFYHHFIFYKGHQKALNRSYIDNGTTMRSSIGLSPDKYSKKTILTILEKNDTSQSFPVFTVGRNNNEDFLHIYGIGLFRGRLICRICYRLKEGKRVIEIEDRSRETSVKKDQIRYIDNITGERARLARFKEYGLVVKKDGTFDIYDKGNIFMTFNFSFLEKEIFPFNTIFDYYKYDYRKKGVFLS